MTVWFAYLTSPLGANVRLKKAFFLGWQDKFSESMERKVSEIFNVERVNPENIDGKYITSIIDPDMNDFVRGKSLELVRIQ